MSQTLAKPKIFIITYDDGEDTQILRVPEHLYKSEEEFQKNIISMKCLHCNLVTNFDCIEKEQEN